MRRFWNFILREAGNCGGLKQNGCVIIACLENELEGAKLEAAHLFESCYIVTERSDGGLAQRGGGR